MGSVRTPSGLDKAGKALWRSIAPHYNFRPDELRILTDACKLADTIELMEVELDGADLIVPGSMKQPTANPMLAEIRQTRAVLAKMLGSLKLPDESKGEQDTSGSALKAAAARWGQRGAV